MPASPASWLSGASELDVADVSHDDESRDSVSVTQAFLGKWARWEGSTEGAKEIELGDIRPGDLLIVDPELGGLSSETWDPSSSDAISDLGDEAQLAYGRRVTLRLDPELPYVDSPPTPAGQLRLRRHPQRFNEAAGIHRRKRPPRPPAPSSPGRRFNEAAGIHRRKHWRN